MTPVPIAPSTLSTVTADTLDATAVAVTQSADYYDSSPRLGEDATSEMVVYATAAIESDGSLGPGNIMYQRLNADGTTSGPVIQVSDGATDDWTYGRFEIRAKLPSGKGTWTMSLSRLTIHCLSAGIPPAICAPRVRPWNALSNVTMPIFRVPPTR